MFAIVHCPCANCRAIIAVNPVHCPSLVVNGERRPLCPACFDRWNHIHKTSKGLAPVALHPDAYKAIDESELP